jgi:putative MATE family efflux protein
MKTKTEIMYATMNPWRLFFVVAAPGMVSMFAMSIYSVVEGIFVGQNLGEIAFAAINISFPVVLINFSLAVLVGVGSSAPISIALGRGDNKAANNIFSCSIILILLASVLMGSVMFFAAAPLAQMMGANDVLLDNCVRYIRTFALCSPLTTVFFAMDNYLRISGYVRYSMVINVLSNFGTIALMALFFLVFRMDVMGSALAVCISMCASSLAALVPFARKKALLQFTKPKFSWAMVKQIAACGSPTFLSTVAGRVTSILMNISLMTIGVQILGEGGGTTAVAACSVMLYSGDICWPLIFGISDSLSPALGYNWGAQDYDRVKKIARCGFIGTAVAAVVTTSFLFFCPRTVASFFVESGDARLLELATRAIRIFCVTYIFRWIVVMTQSYLSAIEKPAQAAMISLAVAIVFPVLLLGSLWGLGLDGIWLNHPGVNFLAAILAGILLVRLGKEIKHRQQET